MSKQTSGEYINLPQKILLLAQRRARALGLTLSGYVQSLVNKDVKEKKKDPWVPMPKHVQKRLTKEVKKFEKELQEGKHKPYTTVDEMMQDLIS